MNLTFAAPCQAMRRYVTTYFLFTEEHAIIEDQQRADNGFLHLLLEGDGHYLFRDGRRAYSAPAFLSGPNTSSSIFSVSGPLRYVGLGLQPDWWGGVVGLTADSLAENAIDAAPYLNFNVDDLIHKLRRMSHIEQMAGVLDTCFLPQIKPIPRDHIVAIEKIREWLATNPFPKVADLYTRFDLSERQVIRICNRYFGAPPKAMARKYSALRAASRIMAGDGAIPEDVMAHYSDHSHIIREVKFVTGQTPRQLRTSANPIMRLTLSDTNFRELLPVS